MGISFHRAREYLRHSLWPAPTAAGLVAIVAEKLLVEADKILDRSHRTHRVLFGGSADSARELLSTIASSLMTFTALVFSITILVLQLASNQFSPRVLPTFLQDRTTHVAMSVFVGSFVYAMSLLPDVRGNGDEHPIVSVFVAFALVLISVAVFIQYIHHMAHAVRAVTLLKRIGEETRAAIDVTYPERDHGDEPPPAPGRPPGILITHTERGGVLAHVDEDELLALAEEADGELEVVPSPGHFVPHGGVLVRAWCTRPLDADVVRDAVLIAAERTPAQDPAFGFRQLVDIAERALSPGVNDPSTAVQALDEIHDLLRLLAARPFPPTVRVDPSGRRRLVVPRPGWSDFVHLALDEIVACGTGSLQVVRRVRLLIEDVLTVARPERRAALLEVLRALDHPVACAPAAVA